MWSKLEQVQIRVAVDDTSRKRVIKEDNTSWFLGSAKCDVVPFGGIDAGPLSMRSCWYWEREEISSIGIFILS